MATRDEETNACSGRCRTCSWFNFPLVLPPILFSSSKSTPWLYIRQWATTMGSQSTITKAHSYNRAAATPRPPFTLLHHPTHRAQCSPLTRISLQGWLPLQTMCVHGDSATRAIGLTSRSWCLESGALDVSLPSLEHATRIAAAFGNARHAIHHCTFPASQPG